MNVDGSFVGFGNTAACSHQGLGLRDRRGLGDSGVKAGRWGKVQFRDMYTAPGMCGLGLIWPRDMYDQQSSIVE